MTNPTPIHAAKLRSFDLLTADSRLSKRWDRQELSWDDLVARLSEPRRFEVDSKRLAAMDADERHRIKDVGGWLAGRSTTGHRKADDVREVRLVRLDMDAAPVDWRDVVDAAYQDLTWMAHTTASHRPDRPRARVIVPLSRAVDAEEYAYVSRKLAERTGEDHWPDHSTFRHNQVAFWPSCASDADFEVVSGAGSVFDVDALLDAVDDWRDVEAWPFRPTGGLVVKGKAEDPREKGGWVGAFCRAYSVTEAIKAFLPDVYLPGSAADRWTHAEGSLRNGLVIYDDDTQAWSHHEISDPAAGKLRNAWDLVRVHKFGELDVNARPRTPAHRLPSFLAMAEFAAKDKAVLAAVVSGEAALADDFDAVEVPDDDWIDQVVFDKNAVPLRTFRNLTTILRGDPRLSGVVRFNELTRTIEIEPERWAAKIGPIMLPPGRDELQDQHISALREKVESLWRREWSGASTHEAIALIARDRAYHPVLDILDAVEWDGVERLDTWLTDYVGCPDNEFVRQAGRKMLVAAVARVRDPGCKWDHMLLLHGEQGAGKSTLCRVLALQDRFFAELRSVEPKIAAETISGVWVVEMCELEAFDRAQISVLKAFVTIQADRYRPAYGRTVEVRPRSCVVIGTTNEVEVLRDSTGNRRFWPVHVGEIDTEGLSEVVLQLYAEADFLLAMGESLYLEGEAIGIAKVEQEAHRQTDPWEDRIKAWLEAPMPADWYDTEGEHVPFEDGTVERDRVCVQEILDECLQIPASGQHAGVRRRIGSIMRTMDGWDGPKGLRFGRRYGAQRGWDRIPF